MLPANGCLVSGSKIGVPNAREIAAPHLGGRDRGNHGAALVLAQALVVAEEERLVAQQRSAERAAELMRVERRLGRREEVARVERLVAVVLEQRAAELVGARADAQVDDGAAEHAELGGRVVRLDLEFLQRFEWRRDVHERVERLVVGHAVEQVVVARPRQAVHAVMDGAARAGSGGILGKVGKSRGDRPRRQRDELLKEAAIERERLNLLVVDDLPLLARRAPDEWRLADHADLFGHGAHFERDVQPRRFRNLQDDAGHDVALEAGELHGHRVLAGRQRRERVGAFLVRCSCCC